MYRTVYHQNLGTFLTQCTYAVIIIIIIIIIMLYNVETFSLPTDAHNVKKHRVIKTF